MRGRFRQLALMGAVLVAVAPWPAAGGTGTDTFGYVWTDSDEPGGPVETFRTWANRCPPGNLPCPDAQVSLALGAWDSTPVSLPFLFPFYGKVYGAVQIFDNGFLAFVPQAGFEDLNKPIPLDESPDGLIAVLWDDLQIRDVSWGRVESDPAGWAVTWLGELCRAPGCLVRDRFFAMAVLFADGTIRFQYPLIDDNQSTTVGIEAEGGLEGIQILYDGTPIVDPGRPELLHNGYVVEFVPPSAPGCAGPTEILCGQTIPSLSPGSPPSPPATLYGCTGEPMEGWEEVFFFDLDEASSVQAMLTADSDLRLFLLEDCDSGACIAGNAKDLDLPFLGAGTWLLAVDGPTPDENGPFTLGLECTALTIPLDCGTTGNAGDTTNGTRIIDSYPCRAGDYSGPERTFTLQHPGGNLAVTLDGPAELDVFILDAADPGLCIDGADRTAAAFNLQAGDYLVAVDGPAGSGDPFTLDVECGTLLDCTAAPPPLSCGSFVTDTTQGGRSDVSRYACNDREYPGPEKVYELVLPSTGDVTVQLRTSDDLEAFILRGCDESSCEAGDPVLGCSPRLDAGSHYIVVDSAAPAGGLFDLEVVCGESLSFPRWTNCEDPVGPDTFPDTTTSTYWHLNDAFYCVDCPTHRNNGGSGFNDCRFAMYAVADCGSEMHLPLFDLESGRLRIFDLLQQEYVELLGETPTWNQVGVELEWKDSGCDLPDPCLATGGDARFNDVTNDVHFFPDPEAFSLCGVYRMEFYDWAGFDWEIFANCDGDRQPVFPIYDNPCDAVEAYDPLPELSLTYSAFCEAGSEFVMVIENLGCADLVRNLPVRISFDNGDPAIDTLIPYPGVPLLANGKNRWLVNFPITPSSFPVTVTVTADPDDGIGECTEVVGTACDPTQGSRTLDEWVIRAGGEDRDRDGLLDLWETDGIDFDGDTQADFLLPGADPDHKDLYIEVDAMEGRAPDSLDLDRVAGVFASVPHNLLGNPDGLDGITLHILLDETDIPLEAWTDARASYSQIKQERYGTAAERADPNRDNLLGAKAKAYRYAVFADSYVGPGGGSTSTGLAEVPGDDFMVTLGEWPVPGGTPDQRAGTFMHELGHTLGLLHGGSEPANFKPNYHSVMNFTWQVPVAGYEDDWILDYSRRAFRDLPEAGLDEATGIDGHAGHLVPIGPASLAVLAPESGPVDWDRDGDTFDSGVRADITRIDVSVLASPDQMLRGREDWSNLHFRLCGHPNFEIDQRPGTTIDNELILATFQDLRLISNDCNHNSLPDAGEVAGGAPECNSNGVLDECDLADGASGDCNLNGVPDDCDIALGSSPDLDGDRVPDECACTPPPLITAALDPDPCTRSGIRIEFSHSGFSGSGHYELLMDGAVALSPVTSPVDFAPPDAGPHIYQIRAVDDACPVARDSGAEILLDPDRVLDAPVFDAIEDLSPCAWAAARLSLTHAGFPAAGHYELWQDGVPLLSPVADREEFLPANDLEHIYVLRAVDETCGLTADSGEIRYAHRRDCGLGHQLLRLARTDGTGLRLDWTPATGEVAGYNLYLGTIGALQGSGAYDHARSLGGTVFPDSPDTSDGCDLAGGPATTARVEALPPDLLYFVLAPVRRDGAEGLYGAGSDATDRRDPAADPRTGGVFCR